MFRKKMRVLVSQKNEKDSAPVVLETQTLEGNSLNTKLHSCPVLALDMNVEWKFSKIGSSEEEISAAILLPLQNHIFGMV